MPDGDRNRLDYHATADSSPPADRSGMQEVVWGLRAMALMLLSGAHVMFAMSVAGAGCPRNRLVALAAMPLWYVPDPSQGAGGLAQRLAGVGAYLPWVVNSLMVGICLTVWGEVVVRMMRAGFRFNRR